MKRILRALLPALLGTAIVLPARGQFSDLNLGNVIEAARGVAKSQEVANMSETDEIAVGRDITVSMFGSYRIVKDEKLQRYLNKVGLWVAMQSERPDLPWSFAAVKSSEVNAFAVPGGTVLVTEGMLHLLSNEAELACVLGHEIGHIVRKHHLSLMQKQTLVQTGSKLVSDNIRGGDLQDQAKKLLVSEGAQIFNRSLDRGSEREADGDGVLLAARAGYDPASCQLFMQRLASQKQDAGVFAALYKTHPQAWERAADIEQALNQLEGASAGSGERPPLGYKNGRAETATGKSKRAK